MRCGCGRCWARPRSRRRGTATASRCPPTTSMRHRFERHGRARRGVAEPGRARPSRLRVGEALASVARARRWRARRLGVPGGSRRRGSRAAPGRRGAAWTRRCGPAGIARCWRRRRPGSAEAPLRERRWALLALAQYQAGRQGDALRTLHRARTVLATSWGSTRGPDLVALEQAILRQDPSLACRGACRSPAPLPLPRSGAVRHRGRRELLRSRRRGRRSACGGWRRSACSRWSGLGQRQVVARAGRGGRGPATRGRRVVVVTPGARPIGRARRACRRGPVHGPRRRPVRGGRHAVRATHERAAFFAALVAHAERARSSIALRADPPRRPRPPTRLRPVGRAGLYLLGGDGATPTCGRPSRARPSGRAAVANPGWSTCWSATSRASRARCRCCRTRLRQTWERREGRTLPSTATRRPVASAAAVAQSAEQLYDRLPDRPAAAAAGPAAAPGPPTRTANRCAPGSRDDRSPPTPSRAARRAAGGRPARHERRRRPSSWPTSRSPGLAPAARLARRRRRGPADPAPPRRRRRRVGRDGPARQRALPRGPVGPGRRLANQGRPDLTPQRAGLPRCRHGARRLRGTP